MCYFCWALKPCSKFDGAVTFIITPPDHTSHHPPLIFSIIVEHDPDQRYMLTMALSWLHFLYVRTLTNALFSVHADAGCCSTKVCPLPNMKGGLLFCVHTPCFGMSTGQKGGFCT